MEEAKAGRPRRPRAPLWLLGALFVVGAVSTGLWLGAIEFPEFQADLFTTRTSTALVVCCGLTSANLILRWSRWHFLIRRFTPELATRDSLAVYLATLPAILSPFFLAELVRVFLIRKRFRTPASFLVRVWITERFLDFCVLAAALSFTFDWRWGLLGTALVLVVAGVSFRALLGSRSMLTLGSVTLASLGVTLLAWSLPVGAMGTTLAFLGHPIDASTALRSFTAGTLLGGITGLPLGVSVAGSTMIEELVARGVPVEGSVLGILVYRAGTAWFAVVLGFVALAVSRERLRRLVSGHDATHFDEIASEYEGEIPAHVRDRLLSRKIEMMDATLAAHGVPKGGRGLDLGCGQGWYLAEMNARGYHVDGTDYSAGQLKKAEAHLAGGAHRPLLVRADAQQLPFPDASYDFVYSINAIHHVASRAAQARVLSEIVRVLRPGGVFLLHEMNTQNPLFRWYMGYLFPLLKKIDEGTEEWILPRELPPIAGAAWRAEETRFFTFLPDFIPGFLLSALAGVERFLERSSARSLSAHYQAILIKPELSRSAESPADPRG